MTIFAVEEGLLREQLIYLSKGIRFEEMKNVMTNYLKLDEVFPSLPKTCFSLLPRMDEKFAIIKKSAFYQLSELLSTLPSLSLKISFNSKMMKNQRGEAFLLKSYGINTPFYLLYLSEVCIRGLSKANLGDIMFLM